VWFIRYLKTTVRQEPSVVVGWFSVHDKYSKSSILLTSVDENTEFDDDLQSTWTVLM